MQVLPSSPYLGSSAAKPSLALYPCLVPRSLSLLSSPSQAIKSHLVVESSIHMYCYLFHFNLASFKYETIPYHYGIQSFRRVPGALGNGPKTLGNCFAECNTRHTTHGIFLSANSYLPSVFLSGTQQSLCRVPAKPMPSAGKALGKDLHSAK